MNKKYISIGLLLLIALAFALLMRQGCTPSEIRNPKSEIVTVPAVDNAPVTAPPTVSVPIPNSPAPNAAMQAELDRYKARYAHYKGMAYDQGQRLAALDSLLAAAGLGCEETVALLREKLAEQDEGAATAAALIDEMNAELAPRRDSATVETEGYRFAWQLDHLGSILPGGFVYDIDLKARQVQCPDCPTPKRPLRRNLSAFYGMGLDGGQRYGLEARRQWRRVSVSGLVVWDGKPAGLVGVGWSW